MSLSTKPKNSKIHFLGDRSYRKSIRLITEIGNKEPVHLAEVEIAGQNRRMYLKYYPEPTVSNNHKGFINEIIGFVLADFVGLPQPNSACLINCKSSVLHRLMPEFFEDNDSSVVLWGAEAIKGKTPAQHFNLAKDCPSLVNELIAWKEVESTIAFDDWLANTDRNLNNLVRVKRNKYFLIDHGWLFSGLKWDAEKLSISKVYENKLELFTRTSDSKKEEDRINRRCFSSESHYSAFEQALAELEYWFSVFLERSDEDLLKKFVSQRAQEENIKARLGVI